MNLPPTISEVPVVTLHLPANSAVLRAAGIDDFNSTAILYSWRQVSGPTMANTSGNATATLTVSDLVEGTYLFEVQLRDVYGLTSEFPASVVVLPALQPRQISAGNNVVLQLPSNVVQLTAIALDSGPNLTSYSWSLISGPSSLYLKGKFNATVEVFGLLAGEYMFQVIVWDEAGATGTANVTVTCAGEYGVPSAWAGNDVVLSFPQNSVQLNGQWQDQDENVLLAYWTVVSGPQIPVAMVGKYNKSVTLLGLVPGDYNVSLTVIDQANNTVVDLVHVSVLGPGQEYQDALVAFLVVRVHPANFHSRIFMSDLGAALNISAQRVHIISVHPTTAVTSQRVLMDNPNSAVVFSIRPSTSLTSDEPTPLECYTRLKDPQFPAYLVGYLAIRAGVISLPASASSLNDSNSTGSQSGDDEMQGHNAKLVWFAIGLLVTVTVLAPIVGLCFRDSRSRTKHTTLESGPS